MINCLNVVFGLGIFLVMLVVPKVFVPYHFELMEILRSIKANLLLNQLLDFYSSKIIGKVGINELDLISVVNDKIGTDGTHFFNLIILNYGKVFLLELHFLELNHWIQHPLKLLTHVESRDMVPRQRKVWILELDMQMGVLRYQNEDQVLLVVDNAYCMENLVDLRYERAFFHHVVGVCLISFN